MSKRRVTPEEGKKCEEKFNKSRAVHSIMRHIAEKLDIELEGLYKDVGWPLYKKYGHAYDAFRIAVTYFSHLILKVSLILFSKV